MAISVWETSNSGTETPSKRDVYFATAKSPFDCTSLKIPFTVASISSTVLVGLSRMADQVSGFGLYIFFKIINYEL
ncbi:hypothetical protein D3C85_1822760 [compost metagenome]